MNLYTTAGNTKATLFEVFENFKNLIGFTNAVGVGARAA
jgi:hypothetical protein